MKDPEWIVRLLVQELTKKTLHGLTPSEIGYGGRLSTLLMETAKQITRRLQPMSQETLADIIVYGDLKLPIGIPAIERKTKFENVLQLAYGTMFEGPIPRPWWRQFNFGKELLIDMAMITLVSIIFDLTEVDYFGKFSEENAAQVA